MFSSEINMQPIIESIGQQKEAILLDQLNDLVSRGLLVIESTEPVLVRDLASNKIILTQKINLTMKDKEYIESLEKQVEELSKHIADIDKVLTAIRK